ncbi:MAG: hypothetical protein HOP31_10315 [Ignavibacteria bacterium]|nr:hypothetical protein [Ignavibacteria bacterium]
MKSAKIPAIFVLAFLMIFISSCSEDEVIVTPENPQEPETLYGAFVLCQGTESYPQERYIGFYDLLKEEYELNIYKPGLLPYAPRSIIYHNGSLYISNSTLMVYSQSKVLKVGAWGSEQGTLQLEQNKFYVPNLLFSFNDHIGLTYFYPQESFTGTLEFMDPGHIGVVTEFPNIKGFITDHVYYDNKLYLTSSTYSPEFKDSSVISISLPDTSVSKVYLGGKPGALILLNNNMLLAACTEGISTFYYVNPATLQKTDSVTYQNGFKKDLVFDHNRNYIYFISADDKIVKFNPVQKTFTTFISNPFSADNYIFNSINFDPHSGKLFVLYSSNSTYVAGKMQIYSSQGYFEKTLTIGKNPIQIVFAKEN